MKNEAENRKQKEGKNMNPEVSNGDQEGEGHLAENENSESPVEITRYMCILY